MLNLRMANYSLINSVVVVILFWFSATAAARKQDDGICKSMAVSQGYICQEHKVTTEDGYILSMQRLPADSFGTPSYKPPVLLQHGILTDGSIWLYNSPNQSLAFILADNGFDVWIGNSRGTTHSKGHTSLCPKDPDYWNWSWDELAAFDLPATINYVHSQTAQKLHYVGQSLGSLTVLAALSQEKLLNTVGAVALFTPIAYLGHTKSLMAKAVSNLFLAEAFYWLGLHEFLPSGVATSMLFEDICNKPGFNCSDIMSAITGPNCCIDPSSEHVLEPQPTATKTMIHLSQMVRRGNLAMYDYGNIIENMVHYKKLTPPTYDLTMIPNDIPLFLGCGEKDFLVDERDMQILLNKLQDHDTDKLTVLKIKDYAHADFLFGFNANQVVYEPLIDFLDSN
ncbi:triacylglycerol lipase 2-like isoform X2 [Mercurialis annua]|uniref:triacylglycerol lipase 2-like isoform X2 n=1 Tax=Mercurialis annua TaxID=3986 RepID=UPI00215F8253|nr:triacylglycerol lipase 2-like isoform X2 [Mercurialis annua]